MHSDTIAWRYGLMNALAIAFIIALVIGNGVWIWAVFGLSMFGLSVIDEVTDIEVSRLNRSAWWFYDANLYLTLPLVVIITVLFVHHVISSDPFGLIYLLSHVGIKFESAHALRDELTVVGAAAGTAYFYGTAGITVAHELVHRTQSPIAMAVGRMLLGFSFSTTFSISHVHGHHRNVATYNDPGSSRRGEYVVTYAVRALIGTTIEAFKIEASRLRRKGVSAWSLQNRAIRGQFYTIAILMTVASFGGKRGVTAVAIAGISAALIDHALEYVQHYGLARVEGEPVAPRHSWDCTRFVTNALQYNLALHSDHHMAGGKPFWDLEARAEAPKLPCGYQTALLIAFIPPLWHRMIDPLIAKWDGQMASATELELIRELGWEMPPPRQT